MSPSDKDHEDHHAHSGHSTLNRLRNRAQKLGERALQEVMSRPQGAEAVGMAIKGVQEGKRMLDAQATNLVGTLGIATQDDLERVSRKVGQARKRLQALLDSLEP